MDNTETPTLKRRLASMLYEAMLLFGVIGVTGALFSVLLEQRHALYLRHLLQAWLFLVLAVYFIWFWTHGGQTLAMKTWRLRLVSGDGQEVDIKRAVVRFALSWLWILPGLAVAWMLGATTWMLVWIPAFNMLLWALTAHLDPQRQFLHDRIAGTRIVMLAERPPKARSAG